MSDYTIHTGDVLDVLPMLESGSINCCVTSPPYFGLRDYGHAGQIGLEPTPDEYVAKLVAVFREVKRVLRDDGTLWLNLGDSYAAQRGGTHQPAETLAGGSHGKTDNGGRVNRDRHDGYNPTRNASAIGMKHKDLLGIPWRVAFALQADGWYLRQDIIWAKPNPMPESVRDRCTKAHEYIFLLSKSARYYYDQDAVKEPIAESTANDSWLHDQDYETGRPERGFTGSPSRGSGLLKPKGVRFGGNKYGDSLSEQDRTKSGNEYTARPTRNRRSVWTVTTKPFTEWGETVHWERVLENDVCDGTTRIVSPSCLAHGDSSDEVSTALHDERANADPSHNHNTCKSHVQAQEAGSLPIVQNNGNCLLAESSGYSPGQHSLPANQSNNETHRNDPSSAHVEHGISSVQKTSRKHCNQSSCELCDSVERKHESNTWPDEMDDHLWEEILPHTVNIVSSSSPVECSCVYYKRTTRKVSHFAVFPPDLIRPCILAGCPEGGIVIDPFNGSGTTGVVCMEENRNYTGIELNPEYVTMARRRISQAQPQWFGAAL